MAGFTLTELMVTVALIVTVIGVTVPRVADVLDHWRARGAASFLSSRIALTRMQAVRGDTNVGLRFEPEDGTYRMRAYIDGNRNGVRAKDIASGIDKPLMPPDRLDQLFGGVDFGFVAGATLIDGTAAGPGADPIRFGASDMVTFSPLGTATPGTLYVRSRGGWQYAVIVLGATGRTRTLQFDVTRKTWAPPW